VQLLRVACFLVPVLVAAACITPDGEVRGDADSRAGTGGVGGSAAGSGGAASGGTAGTGTGGAGTGGGPAGSAGLGGSAGAAASGGAAGFSGSAGATAGVAGAAGTLAGSGGTAGSGGLAGGAGSAGSGPVYEPGPPYTFPQGYRSSRCTYPTGANPAEAKKAFDRWKTELVTSEGAGGNLRVRRPGNEGDTTVSEGIAYGMIFAVVFDEQDMFDRFWKYSQAHVNQNGLMNWRVQPDGSVNTQAGDGGAATDADEDIAWALVMADKKWGGSGSLGMPYIDLAKAQIGRIWEHEVDHGRGELLIAGDSWGPTVAHNPSYFAPNQYRRFAAVTGNMGWLTVIEKNYAMLASTLTSQRGNANNGLVPAWTDANGNPSMPFMGAPTHYQYDSARMPFRIAQDWCDFGEPRAKAYLDKTSAFFSGVGASNIVDGYDLDGSPRPEHPLPTQSALFVGAAGVGAMSAQQHQAFVDATYQLLVTKEMLPESYYYNLCWQVFSLAMMTGNLYDYTLVP
jgi:endo-1,4-beta-D-glucanase Y